MPRKRLSEFRAKTLVCQALGLKYTGWSIDAEAPLAPQLQPVAAHGGTVAVKVDQGVKGRFKKGLVLLNVGAADAEIAVQALAAKGYRWVIIEPQLSHQQADERYLSITYGRDGTQLTYSSQGGIDIESHADSLTHTAITDDTDWSSLALATDLSAPQLRALVDLFHAQHMTFLEINPYFRTWMGPRFLDLAIEVDDASAYFVDGWQESDFRSSSNRKLTQEELTIIALAEKSPASFKLDVIDPNGGIFLLLSGGGASIAVADEIYNLGHGKQLANYGEYSGNPNAEETFIYSLAVLRLLAASKAKRKMLFIGGAVANFTDISNTFNGIIKALHEVAPELKRQNVKVYVRRGGPRQEIGLAKIEQTLRDYDLLGAVHDPSVTLPHAVGEALTGVTE